MQRPDSTIIAPPDKHVAIIGGGMMGTYLLRHLIANNAASDITIIEKSKTFGPGLAYSSDWVDPQNNFANSGSQEIPDLIEPLDVWLKNRPLDQRMIEGNAIPNSVIHKGKIFPRAVLGEYFSDQFKALVALAQSRGIRVHLKAETSARDIIDDPKQHKTSVLCASKGLVETLAFDTVINASGHVFSARREPSTPGYYDSPWPIHRLLAQGETLNCPIAIKGSSLSAVDVALTMASKHGQFERDEDGKLHYVRSPNCEKFRLDMLSRRGLLPNLRCHFEYPEHDIYRYISKPDIEKLIAEHDGHLPLDYMFSEIFKKNLAQKPLDPSSSEIYEAAKDKSLEDFVRIVEQKRQSNGAFKTMAAELAESDASLRDRQPIYWKEVLDDVMYTIGMYAHYMTAEDMIRFQRQLMPLGAYVIAFMPLESAEKILALNEAGVLQLHATGSNYAVSTEPHQHGATLHYTNQGKSVDTHYPVYIDATGQKPARFEDYPYPSLRETGLAKPAEVVFANEAEALKESTQAAGEPHTVHQRNGRHYLQLGGVQVDDDFRLVGKNGVPHPRIYETGIANIMGCYPYCQALPFCNDAALDVVSHMVGRDIDSVPLKPRTRSK